jgi:hypothetical protein
VEPILRYHRARFRGADSVVPGTPRYELGLQGREDPLHRLLDVWATGEAAAALCFAAARTMDDIDALEKRKKEVIAEMGIAGEEDEGKAVAGSRRRAIDFLSESMRPEGMRDDERFDEMAQDDLIKLALADALGAVLSPACKLWNTGHGAAMMREAVSLMGGLGITDGCPGFLGYKWMDAQLEATYEGPEAVQRRLLSLTMTDEVFLAQFQVWVDEMRHIAARKPGTGACTVASAMELWLWTLHHLRVTSDAWGDRLFQGPRQGVTFALADALCWILGVRYMVLDAMELEAEGPSEPQLAGTLPGLVRFMTDLCHVQAARAAGEVGRICAELVNGYKRHPAWDAQGRASCFGAGELALLELVMPGIESSAGAYTDVIAEDGSHRSKAGPCVTSPGLDDFRRLRARLDGCLTGARLAKDRAARSLATVKIPEKLDY